MRIVLLITAALLAQQLPPRDVATGDARAATAAIHGRVIDDIGQPLNRALVVAVGVQPEGARTTMTDAQGRFSLEELPAGRVTLTATRAPYPRTTYGQLVPGDAGTEIVLTPGRRVAATIVMPRGAVVTGTVQDSSGKPAGNLHVGVISAGDDPLRVGGVTAPADREGRFRAWGLPAGDYAVIVRHPFNPSRILTDPSSSVSVRAGEERHVNVRLPEEDATVHRVEGSVLMPDGAFIPGTSVRLFHLGTKTGVDVTSVMPDGSFTAAAVPPGRYRAVSRATRYGELVPGRGRKMTTFWGSTEFSVDADMVIAVRLAPGATVSGNVTVIGDGLDPSRLYLFLQDADRGDMMFGAPGTSPTRDGAFAIEGVSPGVYELTVSATTSPGWTIASAIVGGVDALDFPLRVPAEGIAGIAITVQKQTTVMTGIVRDAAEAPAPHTGLLLYAKDDRFWFKQSRRVVLVRPDSDGRYSVSGIPAGEYSVAIVTSLPTSWQSAEFLRTLRPSASVTLRDGETLTRDFVVHAP